MVKRPTKVEILVAGMVTVMVLSGILLYPFFPENMASHWNIQGEVNGYMPKIYGVFLMPVIYIFLLALFMLMPRVDPLKENIEKFRKYFDGFVVVLFVFLFYVHALTIAWNLGIRFDMMGMIVPAFAILFYCLGILMEKTQRNWFIGIRTPWTLSSEEVWKRTNKIGGKLFKLIGIVALFGVFFGDYAIIFVVILLIASSLLLFAYSYFEYQKIRNEWY